MQVVNWVLCSLALLTCLACMVLLFRGYARSGLKLLLWSAVCFVFLTANNVLLFIDVVIDPELDLRAWRFTSALCGIGVLVIGLVREPD
jgi:hypothetical protein